MFHFPGRHVHVFARVHGMLKTSWMFDFERLEIYNHLRNLNAVVFAQVLPNVQDQYLREQLKRAQLGTLLNLAEGTGRMSKADKKEFYTVARSSIFEVVAILHVLLDSDQLDPDVYKDVYDGCEQGSKMLLGMIRSMD